MKKNMGTADRIIRLVAGIAVGGVGIYFQSIIGIIAIPLVLTAAIGFCPAYLPLGISTCGTKKKKRK
jgi:hypothetical protein